MATTDPLPSQDLNKLASSQGLKFFGSTSTLTSCLSQIYFLIGRWKEVNLSMLSAEWQNAVCLSNFFSLPFVFVFMWKLTD